MANWIVTLMVAGRKIQGVEDPNLANEHAAGSLVRVMQPALHEQHGLIELAWPRYWMRHSNAWSDAENVLVDIEGRILAQPVHKSNERVIVDDELIAALYKAGTDLC